MFRRRFDRITPKKGLVCAPLKLLFLVCATTIFVGKSIWDWGPQRSEQTLLQVDSRIWRRQVKSVEANLPLIYLYNKFHKSSDWGSSWEAADGSKVLRTLQYCPIKCQFTSAPQFLKPAELVLVSLAHYKVYGGKPVNLTYSKGAQIWAGFLGESPDFAGGYVDVDGILDASATYRRDSDIPLPYGGYERIDAPQFNVSLENLRQSLENKKLAAWLVSHCGAISQRDVLVKTLQRYMPVDVFGGCSKRKCPETKRLSCRDYLGQNYKFYLAFENSLCVDYVTEKFFLAYQYNMVPVTFGWANYSLYGPPGSYINALDYDSVEDLANYLLYLDKNDEEYLKYFASRGKYVVHSGSMNLALCKVCKAVNNFKEMGERIPKIKKYSQENESHKGYPSFRKWFMSFPDGQTSALRHIGQKIMLNTTGVCIQPKRVPEFERWIRGDE